MHDPELPLIGLLEDAILVGEERSFAPPVLTAPALLALSTAGLTKLCAVTIASPVELPTFVGARWGTECTVLEADKSVLRLRGERRVRVLKARGAEAPFLAEVESIGDQVTPEGLLKSAHTLIAALETGAMPS